MILIKINYKIILGIFILIVIIILISKPWKYILSNEKYIENNVVSRYYEVIDAAIDIDKYNSLIVPENKLENLDGIPKIVAKRDILEIKELNSQEHPVLKQYINEKHIRNEANIKFYFVEYNIKFKDNVASPVESGKYCEVLTLEKRGDNWLINGDIHKAINTNGTITVLAT